MPYIKHDDQTRLFPVENALTEEVTIETPGELNYLVTLCVLRYMETHKLNYQTVNDIMGALDGASKEFYRRVAIPYEDRKISDNGDVYPPYVTTD